MMTPEKTQQLFDALELDALPADDQEEVLLTMGELIFKDTLIRCLEAMSSSDRAELARLADSGAPPDDVAGFIVARVPDADQRAAAAVDALADDILAVTKP
jgi:hypothetical protein